MGKKLETVPGHFTSAEILAILANEKERYTQLIRQMQYGLRLNEGVGDQEEAIVADAERDTCGLRIDHIREILVQIGDAEIRVSDGSYGICLDCSDQIGHQRLVGLPWAARCVRCQELTEEAATLITTERIVQPHKSRHH